MSFSDNIPKLKPYSRSVSIVGVGVTPFRRTKDDPNLNGITEGELFGYAAIEAMRDAGINGKDVDFFVHGQAGPGWTSNFATPNMHVANWLGMKGKASIHQSEACATGYVALETAVAMVASGTYDTVLSGCVEMPYSIAHPTRVLTERRYGTDAMFHETLCSTMTRDYNLFTKGILPFHFESWLQAYKEEHNMSDEQVDEVLTRISINARHMASINGLSLNFGKDYTDKAHELGMETAEEYLHSKYNPKLGTWVRVSNFEERCDGAGAFVVMPTEMAYKYTDHPIEVLGVGHSCVEYANPQNERIGTINAYKQVRELTGLTGADMDLFMTNDFFLAQQLLSAEECEYLPKGEGWKYMLDDRCTFKGDRPVQTNGGRCHYGHAAAASGVHDIYETVMQMRGEADEHQIKDHEIKHAMIRGFGGGQNLLCLILRKL
ncbi:MAG: thiolase family protein [Parasporobacterium sp.]|nr:thiolase family protein [Parasporobacterium sp.]